MSEIDLRKKTYTYSDLESLLAKLKFEYEKKLAEQRERILDLRGEVQSMEKELSGYKSRSRHINKALIAAVAKAEELETAARQKYDMELKSLRLFHTKWLGYYNKIIAKYPIDDELLKAARFNDKMNKIFRSEGARPGITDTPPEPLNNNTAAEADTDNYKTFAARPPSNPLTADPEREQEALNAIRAAAQNVKDTDPAPDDLSAADSSIADDDYSPEAAYRSERARLDKESGETAEIKSSAADINKNNEPVPAIGGLPKYYNTKNPEAAKNYMRSGTNGFSLEEALNPTQSLQELIKEVLGE